MTQSIILKVKRLSDKAKIPTRGSIHAAGYDLCRYYYIIKLKVQNL